jgi:mono/diheme cytochrome c family protein
VKGLVLFLLALVLVAALPACGGGEDESAEPETVEGTVPTETGGAGGEGNAENGKSVYASAGCGGCHALSDAGSTGTVGPSLDESQLDEAAIAEQVRNGGGGMPAFADRLSDQEIADVSAYVASASGS